MKKKNNKKPDFYDQIKHNQYIFFHSNESITDYIDTLGYDIHDLDNLDYPYLKNIISAYKDYTPSAKVEPRILYKKPMWLSDKGLLSFYGNLFTIFEINLIKRTIDDNDIVSPTIRVILHDIDDGDNVYVKTFESNHSSEYFQWIDYIDNEITSKDILDCKNFLSVMNELGFKRD